MGIYVNIYGRQHTHHKLARLVYPRTVPSVIFILSGSRPVHKTWKAYQNGGEGRVVRVEGRGDASVGDFSPFRVCTYNTSDFVQGNNDS